MTPLKAQVLVRKKKYGREKYVRILTVGVALLQRSVWYGEWLTLLSDLVE